MLFSHNNILRHYYKHVQKIHSILPEFLNPVKGLDKCDIGVL